MSVSPLRGRIVAMFGTIGKFAEAIGWSRRKVSNIVNKKQEATASDIEKMAEILQITLPDEFRILFLT